jgi:hypothetical protein
MTEGQEVIERTNHLVSVKDQPTNTMLAQTYMGVFFIPSVSDTIFAILFFRNRLWTVTDHLANCCGPLMVCRPQFEKHCPTACVCSVIYNIKLLLTYLREPVITWLEAKFFSFYVTSFFSILSGCYSSLFSIRYEKSKQVLTVRKHKLHIMHINMNRVYLGPKALMIQSTTKLQ